jgi:hypothetical protein
MQLALLSSATTALRKKLLEGITTVNIPLTLDNVFKVKLHSCVTVTRVSYCGYLLPRSFQFKNFSSFFPLCFILTSLTSSSSSSSSSPSFYTPNMDPFDPHAISVARHAETNEQRTARESQWAHQVNPHLSNDQARSLFDIAEAILQQGFTGSYNQTMRLARATRRALLEYWSLYPNYNVLASLLTLSGQWSYSR